MAKVDTTSPVLVTGATGYVAGVLIQHLLEAGCVVHGTVRDPSKKERYQYLLDLADKCRGSIKIFGGDLMEDGSFAEAMKGCTVVFHTASPFFMSSNDPQKDLIDPAVSGTKNVLNQASKTPSVKRVVLTSSVAAIYRDASESAAERPFTEEMWNRTSTAMDDPYRFSKTVAEQTAWVMAGSQTQWTMVAINPSFVMGPGVAYHPSSTSVDFLRKLGDGTLSSGCARLSLGIVDVRDVAKAHIVAAFSETAQGRYLVSGYDTHVWEMVQLLREKYPKYPLPVRAIPKPVLLLASPFTPQVTFHYVWHNCDIPLRTDNTKAKQELGLEFRPLRESLFEMYQQILDAGGI